ncbi:MAG: glycosyltransferase [Bacteroidales bacterium]|nr:glycosyltransferase [Bacteroidales bacterium]
MNSLVSIIVISYNSSEYIIETLESIRLQTYYNIELIISDDGSSDTTLQICRQWIEENKDRFINTELISVPENTGIPANCNRGLLASHGEWFKLIAGDDLLDQSCIKENIGYVNLHPICDVVISKYQIFDSTFHPENFAGIRPPDDMLGFFEMEPEEQLRFMRFRSEHLILGMMVRTKTLRSVGGFDESYRLFEDLPLLINLLNSGNRFFFLPKVTAYYRRNVRTVSNQSTRIYKILLKEMLKAYKKLRRPFLKLTEKIHVDLYFINEYILVYFFHGESTRFYLLIKRLLYQMSPIQHKMRLELKQNLKNSRTI